MLLELTSYCSEKYCIRRKKSPIAVVGYVVDGEGYIVKGGIAHLVTRDMIYFCYADEPHHYYASPNHPWIIIWMNLSGDLANELAKRYEIFDSFLFDGTGLKYLFDKTAALVHEKERTNFDCQKTIAMLYVELLMELRNRVQQKRHHPEAVRLKNFIDANTHRLVGNAELSSLIFHSSDYCIRLFKKEYGKTPYDYQLNQKMNIACQMLRQTESTVFEIATSLGYNDAHYFSGLFKSKCGLSPNAYRKKYK